MNEMDLGALFFELDHGEMEEMNMLLNMSNIAAAFIMELEEGDQGFLDGAWEKVTVDIEEYYGMSDRCFAMHFRMSKGVFDELVTIVGDHLKDMGRWRRTRIPLHHILMMVIWVLATPDSFRSIALRFGVTPGVLHFHYVYIIEALRELAPRYIRWPDAEEREQIMHSFERATGFPGVIGCIDCTHVYITKPLEQSERYINRHHSYSLSVQAVVDNNLLVRDLHVGEAGSLHDMRIFRRSPLYKSLIEDADHNMLTADQHLVGDGAYTLTHFVLIPFENNGHRTHQQLIYNKKLSQCRVRVENGFGRAKGKWRRMKFLHAFNARIVVDHITASFVLHNFIITHGEPLFQEEELAEPLRNDYEFQGNDDEDDEGDIGLQHPLLEEAKLRGAEKRMLIMHFVFYRDGDP